MGCRVYGSSDVSCHAAQAELRAQLDELSGKIDVLQAPGLRGLRPEKSERHLCMCAFMASGIYG